VKLPRKLPLLPGLRWEGHLTVSRHEGDGRWLVDWDATDSRAHTERWIGDRSILTTEQIREWTGVEMLAAEQSSDVT
jgi:hypothetical protein